MSWSATGRGLGSGLVLSTQTLFEPERVALELDDMATVGEAIQERRGEPGITKDLSPTGEVPVTGNSRSWAFSSAHPASLSKRSVNVNRKATQCDARKVTHSLVL